jgi:small-conductance mechanosensitive channel
MDFYFDRRFYRLTSSPSSNCFAVTVVIAAIVVCCSFFACFALAQESQGILGTEQEGAIRSAFVGEWICNIGHSKIVFKLMPEGDFNLDDQKGQYVLDVNIVRLKTDTAEVSYQFELTASELTLSGGDLKQPLKFTRMQGLNDYQDWLSYLSPQSLLPRLKRIGVIAVIAVSCRVLLLILQTVIHFVIYCNRGPLKFVFGHHKNRTMTMYSLLINLSKYVVYLITLGFILTELGINYTAYLASLSVVGLAIGFGSQGLVQDMVTGFFIVFEEQFNVGDMVEIPPHVGIVQELGIRMTKHRNYFGQKVVIPNRNIATVGNYTKGAQQVNIDVAAASLDTAEKMKSYLVQIVDEIGRQFEEVILSTSEISETVSLSTGEHFARLSLAIWPQQQWVIEQETVPRIRSALQNKGFEIPNDKVCVFYHPREQQPIGVHNRSKNNSHLIQLKRQKQTGSSD